MSVDIYKQDGSIQCSGKPGVTLDEARHELASAIGEQNILDGKKCSVPGFQIQLCGAPSSAANCFTITDAGDELLFKTGITGNHGFKRVRDYDIDPGFNPAHQFEVERQAGRADKLPGREAPQPAGGAVADHEPGVPFPFSMAKIASLTSARTTPMTVRELIGFRVRVIKEGEGYTRDLWHDRVNLFVNDEGRITDISFF